MSTNYPRKRGHPSSPNGEDLKRMRLGNDFRNDFGADTNNTHSEIDNTNSTLLDTYSNNSEKSDIGYINGNRNQNFNYNFSYNYNDFNSEDETAHQQEYNKEDDDSVVEMQDRTEASIVAIPAAIGTARRSPGGSLSTLQAIISTDANAQWDALPRRQIRRHQSMKM